MDLLIKLLIKDLNVVMDTLSVQSAVRSGRVVILGLTLGKNANGVTSKSIHTGKKISKSLILTVSLTIIKSILVNFAVSVRLLVATVANKLLILRLMEEAVVAIELKIFSH